MSLAKAIPVQAHVPAIGWRLALPAANSDDAASRQKAIPRHRIFMVLLLRSVSRILRRNADYGFPSPGLRPPSPASRERTHTRELPLPLRGRGWPEGPGEGQRVELPLHAGIERT